MSRSEGIGASEVWMVYDDPMALYLRKVGITEDAEENEAMWLGKEMEPVLDKRYFKETGFMPEDVPPIIHAKEPWRRCTPDRIVVKNGIKILLEYKTTGIHADWGTPGTDEVPFRVGCQVQWQLSLMPEIQDAEIPVYFLAPRREFVIYKISRNQEVIDNLIDAARYFWLNHVVPQVPPPIDASNASRDLLRHLYPDSKGEVLPAPDSALDWRVMLEIANDTIKTWEEKKKLAQYHLEALVGDADSLLWPDGWRFDWKRQKNSFVTDWQAVAKATNASDELITKFTSIKAGIRIPRLWPPKKEKK